MRDNNQDMRVIRTKSLIQNALVELIEEKGFEAMTVKDITTKASINRGTFYAHYQDKFDLMNKCQDEIMQGMSNIFKHNISDVITEFATNTALKKPFTIFISIFEYINVNSKFMKAVLGPKGDLSFQTKLKDFIWKTLFESNQNSIVKEENFLVPGHYLTSYIASAHLGVIQQWLDHGKKESPQEMAHILSTITVNGPFFATGLKN